MKDANTFYYTAGEYHDAYYDVYISIDNLIEKLKFNKLKKADRELLIEALNVISNLKK